MKKLLKATCTNIRGRGMACAMTNNLNAKLQAELTAFAEELAEAARAVILPYWRKPIAVESKIEADRPVQESPVTVADRAAETAMRALIEKRYPAHGIYGEEVWKRLLKH